MDTTACTMPVSIILAMTLPILAMVMAPERVRTTLQSGSLTMARVTSRASPRLRPENAVFDMARSRPEKDLTSSRSRLSRATRPSLRPSWKSRVKFIRASPPPRRWYNIGAVPAGDLKRRLDELYLHYDHRFVDPDPLQFVRAQSTAADREVVGLLASALAFGNVKAIKGAIAAVLGAVGPSPAQALCRLDPKVLAQRLDRFRHRWISGRDVACLLHFASEMRASHGLHRGLLRGGPRPRGRRRGARPLLVRGAGPRPGSRRSLPRPPGCPRRRG